MKQYFEWRPPTKSAFAPPHWQVVPLTEAEYIQRMDFDARRWTGKFWKATGDYALTQPARLPRRRRTAEVKS